MYKQALFPFLTIVFLLTPLTEAQTFLNTKKILNPPNPSLFTKDKFGNYYTAYNFSGTLVIDTFHLTSFTPGTDIALAKFDSTGKCLWVKKAGGKASDGVTRLICDTEGSIIIGGNLQDSVTFDTITIPGHPHPMGASDFFAAKYSSQGKCLWARGFGTAEDDVLGEMGLDEQNNIYIAGSITGSGTYPIRFDSIIVNPPNGDQICLLKLNKQGKVVWAKTPGSNGWDRAQNILVKPSGGFYVSGYTASNAIFDTITLRHNGTLKLCLAEYNDSGVCVFAGASGGSPINYSSKISYDDLGNIFISGLCSANAYFDSIFLPTGAYDLNCFFVKYSPTKKCIWAKSAAITNYQKFGVSDLVGDNSGNCYVTGWFKDTLTFDGISVISKGDKDAFFAKFDPTGRCRGLVRAGSQGSDYGNDLSISATGLITATGFFAGTADFGTTVLTGGGTFSTQFSDITTGTDWFAITEVPKKEISFSGYPNPFQQSVLLQFTLPEDSYVTLTMYNIQGEKIYCAANQFYSKGQSSVDYNPKGLSSGMYIAELQTKVGTQRIKLMNIR